MAVRSSLRLLLTLALAATVAACDGDDDDGPAMEATMDIVVTPSLGKIVGGGVQAFDANGDPLSDEIDTDGSGVVTLPIPASHGGPVLILVRGKAGATYFDEATGEDEDFPDGQEFRAALPEPVGETGVSILTELAVRLAEASGESVDSALLEAANEEIRAALAPEVTDLLTPPTIVDGATGAGDVDDTDAGQLAARLGALANLAQGDATPALTVLQQLAADVEDGAIDGFDGAGEPLMTAYAPASFAADFVRAVQDFAAAFGDADLQGSAEGARAEVAFELDPGAAGSDFDTEAGTVNGDLIGDYTLVYSDADPDGGRDPFADGEEVAVSVTQDNALTLGDIGPLTAPFLSSGPGGGAVNPAELIWEDPDTGLFYALSNNDTGTFNEINVGDPQAPQQSGFPGFVGQLSPSEPDTGSAGPCGSGSGTSLVSNCAGTYAVSSATGGSHTAGEVVIGTDGSVDFDVNIAFTAGEIEAVFDRLSVDRRIQINYDADQQDSGDVILIFLNEALDAVERIVYRNRNQEIEIEVVVAAPAVV